MLISLPFPRRWLTVLDDRAGNNRRQRDPSLGRRLDAAGVDIALYLPDLLPRREAGRQ